MLNGYCQLSFRLPTMALYNTQNFLWGFIRKHSNALCIGKSYSDRCRAHLAVSTEFHPKQMKAVYVTWQTFPNIATIVVWTVYQTNIPLTNQPQLVSWCVTMTTGLTWSLSKLTGFIAAITQPRLLDSCMVTTDLSYTITVSLSCFEFHDPLYVAVVSRNCVGSLLDYFPLSTK